MKKLNFPDFEFKYQKNGDKLEIYDIVRKKYVDLTPEEWVRQHVIRYLLEYTKVPEFLIAVEKEFRLFRTIKRADIVVFGNNAQPILLVECKSYNNKITKDVLNQALAYSLEINAKIIMLTNGLSHYIIKVEGRNSVFLDKLPSFEELKKF